MIDEAAPSVVFATGARSTGSRARSELGKALVARDAQAWESAALHYSRYLDSSPDDFAIWVQLGHALKESGRTVDALAAYSEAMRLNDRDPDLLLNFGHLYKVMGLREEAIGLYRRSATLDGNAHAVGELRALGVEPPEVSPWLKSAAPTRTARAGALARTWRRLRSLFEHRIRRSVIRGDRARDRGDWDEAARRYRDHLDAHRSDVCIWVQFGHALKEGGRPLDALAAYQTAQAIGGDDADLLLQLGHVHKVLGRTDDAGVFFRRAVALGEPRAAGELQALTSLSRTPPATVADVVFERPPSVAGSAKVLIVVPLYKTPELVPGLIDSLVAIAYEIRAQAATVVLINDSPDHPGLARAIEEHVARLRAVAPVEVVTNERNLGFVGSANGGLQMALQAGADVLLLNSDALMAAGALTELVEVAYSDTMISAVSPRSNNATICNSPYPEHFRALEHGPALDAHRQVSHLLPRVTYVPTAVGFCLYIKRTMIVEFGVFDTIYGGGYNEENDFLFRCNRRGYRAALANHAYAFHIGSVSFSKSVTSTQEREAKNHAILVSRYPEYDRSVQRYLSSSEYEAQRIIAGVVHEDRKRVIFDCHNVGAYHAGTFEYMKQLIAAFVRTKSDLYEFYISCSHAALVFHGFDKIVGLRFCWGREREMAPFAAAIRLSQPFSRADLQSLRTLAPVTGFVMLDTIAMDCQYLDDQDLAPLWRQMLETTDMLGYLSGFSRDEFVRRFNVPDDVEQFVALCSTAAAEYLASPPAAAQRRHILVVGNHYAHKHVHDAIVALKRAGVTAPIVALGLEPPPELGATGYKAGELSQGLVDSLYDGAIAMVFPSHLEGFGLPVMHALSRSVPVIARRLPVLEEIRRKTELGGNIHLFDTTAEMAAQATRPPPWASAGASLEPVHTWADCAEDLAGALERAFGRLDYATLARRIARAGA